MTVHLQVFKEFSIRFFSLLIILLLPMSADALTLNGHCKNWSEIAFEEANDTRKACARLNNDSWFVAIFDEHNAMCRVCDIEDWVPSTSSSGQAAKPMPNATSTRCADGMGKTGNGRLKDGKYLWVYNMKRNACSNDWEFESVCDACNRHEKHNWSIVRVGNLVKIRTASCKIDALYNPQTNQVTGKHKCGRYGGDFELTFY